jgi:hypothetical protein
MKEEAAIKGAEALRIIKREPASREKCENQCR